MTDTQTSPATLKVSYDDKPDAEAEIDADTTISVHGPARNADGSVGPGHHVKTFLLKGATKVEMTANALKDRLDPSGQNPTVDFLDANYAARVAEAEERVAAEAAANEEARSAQVEDLAHRVAAIEKTKK